MSTGVSQNRPRDHIQPPMTKQILELSAKDVVTFQRRLQCSPGWPARCMVEVECGNFNYGPTETPTTKTSMSLPELLNEHD